MTKAVIFDLDDTLVKTYKVKWAHHKAVAKQFYGLELTDEEIKAHWGKPFNLLLAELFKNADSVENIIKAYKEIESQFLKELHDDSLHIVGNLIDNNIAVGLVSAMNKDFVISDMSRLGFPVEKFLHIQGANDTLVHKPDPGVFTPALEKLSELGIRKEQAVYVGDALIDYQAALGAGLDFVAVTTGLTPEEEFKAAGVKKIIRRIGELPEKLS